MNINLFKLIWVAGVSFFAVSAHAEKYRTLYSCEFTQNIAYEISLNNDVSLNLWALAVPIEGLAKERLVSIQSAGLTTIYKQQGQKYIDSGLSAVLSFDSSQKLRPLTGIVVQADSNSITNATVRIAVGDGSIIGYHIQRLVTAIAQSLLTSTSPVEELKKDKDWKVTEMKCSKI